jgi:hypothetical protein
VGLLLFVLAFVGYPLVGLTVSILGVETTIFTLPYRLAILVLSCALLFSRLLTPFQKVPDFWLITFMLMYLARLLFDMLFNSILGNMEALAFYVAIVLIPTLAILCSNMLVYSDQTIARCIVALGLVEVTLALAAQTFALAENPWGAVSDERRLGFVGLNPISLGYLATTTVIASGFLLTLPYEKYKWKAFSVAGLLLGCTVMLAAGSRGPIISIAICMVFYAVTKIQRTLTLAPTVLLGLTFGIAQTDVVERLVQTINGGWQKDGSSLLRIESQRLAIADFQDSPIIGKHFSNPTSSLGDYPHNILIESLMALGLLGSIILIFCVLRALKNATLHHVKVRPLITILFVQSFVNSLLSGALWGVDTFYILALLMLMPGQKEKMIVRGLPSNLSGSYSRHVHRSP